MASRRFPGRGRPPNPPASQPGPSSMGIDPSLYGFGGLDPMSLLDGNVDLSGFMPLPTATGGRGIVRACETPKEVPKETGIDYVKRMRLAEEEAAIKVRLESLNADDETMSVTESPAEVAPSVTNLDGVSTVLPEQPNLINFENFVGLPPVSKVSQKTLPIDERRTEILKSIRMNQVTIISGPTGCGKTTQVPLFIMDEMIERKEQFNIIVTQPRRIAARSVAQRVADLKNMRLGEGGCLVGYQIGMDRTTVTPDVHLLFVTTGVLLQRLINTKSINSYTHIIIDEIHERNVETDFVLMIIRKLLWSNSKTNIKLILMSATFDIEKLLDYFTLESPTLNIPSIKPNVITMTQRPAKIQCYYLNQFDDIGVVPTPKKDEFKLEEPVVFPQLYDVVAHILNHISMIENAEQRDRGGVLIFLPGLNEINDLLFKLQNPGINRPNNKLWLLPLHSSINADEQRKVFVKPGPGERKVVLATNIAESSITVTDIDYVIDFCLTKNLVVDRETNLPSLKLEWATKTNCKQREGRTGRLRDGRVFRLVYPNFYHTLNEYPEPEIRRTTLELCVLQTKIFNMGHPKELLALCMDPPNLEDIRNAVLKLKRLGALTIFMGDNTYDDEDGELTILGKMMSTLPIDVHLSKLIVMGFAFGLIEEAVVMAACLTIGSLFSKPYGRELDGYKSKLTWANRSFCDLMASLNAYNMYSDFANRAGIIVSTYNSAHRGNIRDHHKERELDDWCNRNFIQPKAAREIAGLIEDLKLRLTNLGVDAVNAPNQKIDPLHRELIMKVMFCGAFYPNYFYRQEIDKESLRRTFPTQNPHTSVVIAGLPNNQGVLYAKQLRDIFKVCSDFIDIEFEDTKAIITFSSDEDPLFNARLNRFNVRPNDPTSLLHRRIHDTAVKNSVYIALVMRKVKPLEIRLLSENQAREVMKLLSDKRENQSLIRSNRFVVQSLDKECLIPPCELVNKTGRFQVIITFTEECSHFFVREYGEETHSLLEKITSAIEEYKGPQLKSAEIGMAVLVKTERGDTTRYLRAIVLNVHKATCEVQVLDVDYGSKRWVSSADLVALDTEGAQSLPNLFLPALALECKLIEVKPSLIRNIYGTWEKSATKFFEELVTNDILEMEIFSVVDSVCRVRLWGHEGCDIGQELCDQGFAETAEEPQMSLQNHDIRVRMGVHYTSQNGKSYAVSSKDLAIPSLSLSSSSSSEIMKRERLKGPSSPLEVKFYNVTQQNAGSNISIDRNSVNTIAIEPEIPSDFQRMIVAATVSKGSEWNNKIIGRQTSMMPSLRAFPSIMCLLFAPCVELRCPDQEKNAKVTGALCGLGARRVDGHLLSLDGGHDIEQEFDFVLSKRDITDINKIRYFISSLLTDAEQRDNQRQTAFEIQGKALYNRQRELRKEVITLLSRRRMKMPEQRRLHTAYKWGILTDTKKPQLHLKNPSYDVFPVPSQLRNFLTVVQKDLELMQIAVREKVMTKTIVCPIDGQKLYTLSDVKTHIEDDKVHEARQRELFIQLEDEKKGIYSDDMDEGTEEMDTDV